MPATRLLVLALWVWCVSARAQHWTFQHYGSEFGLHNANPLALQQDGQGFLWVATEGGMYRFDGDGFRPFPLVGRTNRGAIARTLHTSPDGQLWAASSAGLFRWTGERFVLVPGFDRLDLDGEQVLASDPNHLYVATPVGLWATSLRQPGVRQVLSAASAQSVFVSSAGIVWFGCNGRLCRLDSGGHPVEEPLPEPGPWNGIVQDMAGSLWIRSAERVLRREPAGHRFERVPGLFVAPSTRGSNLSVNRQGEVLIPHGSGLAVCHSGGCRQYGTTQGLRRAEVMQSLEDREGSLWLGYSGQGLCRLLGRDQWLAFGEEEGLTDPAIWRIAHSVTGELWIGTNRGLFQGKATAGRWSFRRVEAAGELAVYGLATAPDGSVWVGTFQAGVRGIVHYEPRSGSRRVYPAPEADTRFSVNELRRQEDGTVWVATGDGLLRLTPGASRLEAVKLPRETGLVYDILAGNGGLLVGCKRGLWVDWAGQRRWLTTADGLREDAVQGLALAPDGAIWLSYMAPVGISRLEVDARGFRLRHFHEAGGLPSDTVYSQFFDTRGRHWLGMGNGVAVEDDGRWVRYDTSDGLVWNDCGAHAWMAEGNGAVWFGTSAGLARFEPKGGGEPGPPETVITSVMRNEQPHAGTDFDPDTRTVTFRFTMLSFVRQNRTYRYRVHADAPWTETRSHEVRLAELPPGRYQFEVQGETESSGWSRPAVRRFRVRAPWYRSIYYQASTGAGVVLLAWLWWRRREGRQRSERARLEAEVERRTAELRKIQDELELRVTERTRALTVEIAERQAAERGLVEAKRRAEESNQAKSQFMANMSHELRTPLNAIIGYSEMLQEDVEDPIAIEDLRRITSAGRHLLELITDVLDLAEIESGAMPVALEPVLVSDMVGEAARIAGPMARRRGNHFQVAPGWPQTAVLIDSIKFRRSLANLLSNACKFTENGQVELSVERRQDSGRDWVCWHVRDTGVGIAAENLPKLFQSFTQLDDSSTRRHDGTGLGLALSQKLCGLMGARITVESAVGRGSVFTIHSPEWHPAAGDDAPTA